MTAEEFFDAHGFYRPPIKPRDIEAEIDDFATFCEERGFWWKVEAATAGHCAWWASARIVRENGMPHRTVARGESRGRATYEDALFAAMADARQKLGSKRAVPEKPRA